MLLTCSLLCSVLLCLKLLLAPVPLATKMSASKLIHFFTSWPAAFGFWSSTPPDSITLTPANRKADQSLIRISDWHWCCCSCHSQDGAAHFSPQSCPCWYCFLSTSFWERSHSCVRSVWFTYQGSWHSGQCCVQLSCDVFNSTSRQHHEVWASQFSFLHSLKDVVPSSEAYLREVAKLGHGLGSISMCKRGLCQSLVVPLWLRGLTWRAGLRLVQVARNQQVVVPLPFLLMLGRCISVLLIWHSPQPPHHPHLWFCRLACMLSHSLISAEALLPTGLCLIWFRVTIFGLGHALPCSIISSSSM